MNELKVLFLHVIEIGSHSFPLHSHLSKDTLHLLLVGVAELFPHFQNCRLEILVDIANARVLRWHPFSSRFRFLDLGPFFNLLSPFGTLRALILSPLPFLLLFSGLAEPLSLGPLGLLNVVVDLLSDLGFPFFSSREKRLEDLSDEGRDLLLGGACWDLIEHTVTETLVTEIQQPLLQFVSSLVKGDPSVDEGGLSIVIVLHGEQSLTEGCLVGWRWDVLNVVDLLIFWVYATT